MAASFDKTPYHPPPIKHRTAQHALITVKHRRGGSVSYPPFSVETDFPDTPTLLPFVQPLNIRS